MVNMLTTIKIAEAKIDGWNWDKLREPDREDIMNKLRGMEVQLDTYNTKKFKNLNKGKDIGIVDKNGSIIWNRWFNTKLDNVNLDVNFLRFLSKGTKYRFRTTKIRKPLRKGFCAKSIRFMEILESESKKLNIKKSNRNVIIGLYPAIMYLKGKKWILRKDDKSDRWVICSRIWETKQGNDILAKMYPKLVPSDLMKYTPSHKIKTLYLLPKTHKGVEPCPARPIQAWPNNKRKLKAIREKLEPLIDRNICEKSCTNMYRLLADGIRFTEEGMERMEFCKGDVKDMYSNIPREELWRILRKKGIEEKDIKYIRNQYEWSALLWRDQLYFTNKGLDMGCVLSPILAQIYMSHKLESINCPTIKVLKVYIDDIAIRYDWKHLQKIINEDHSVITINSKQDAETLLKKFIEFQVLPLKIDWEDGNNVLDVIWEENVMIRSTKFNDRDRKFSLDPETELPNTVKVNSIVQQVDRIAERDGYTFGFSRFDNLNDICKETIQESKATWVWYQHRAQTGSWIPKREEGLFGDIIEDEEEKTLYENVLSIRGNKYCPILEHTDSNDCNGCKWGLLWSKWMKKTTTDEQDKVIISCAWYPEWDSKKGRLAVRRSKKLLARELDVKVDMIKIRWKPQNKASLNMCMVKS